MDSLVSCVPNSKTKLQNFHSPVSVLNVVLVVLREIISIS